jgi:hypothetical protein
MDAHAPPGACPDQRHEHPADGRHVPDDLNGISQDIHAPLAVLGETSIWFESAKTG